MGLAASQARLLTITARKSDCEYASMALSHQKIALSRDMNIVSSEYQDALNKTKLVYDFYGTGDTNTPLSYNLLMQPSKLNDYIPSPITDTSGRVVLDAGLAAAARAAGIPQEGLGCSPSSDIRNNFVSALADNGVISEVTRDQILQVQYNPLAGLGGEMGVVSQTRQVSLTELTDILKNYSMSVTNVNNITGEPRVTVTAMLRNNSDQTFFASDGNSTYMQGLHDYYKQGYFASDSLANVSLGDMLEDDYVLTVVGWGNRTSSIGYDTGALGVACSEGFWNDMFSGVEAVLSTGDFVTEQALAYARSKTEYLVTNQSTTDGKLGIGHDNADDNDKWQFFNDQDMCNVVYRNKHRTNSTDAVLTEANNASSATGQGYIGLCVVGNADTGHDDKNGCESIVSINVSSILRAYLTYFADYMNGIYSKDEYGNEKYEVNNTLATSRLVDENTMFTIKSEGVNVNGDNLMISDFYDVLFNQIATKGWVSNDGVQDNDYLKTMLQNGSMYISTYADDGYYYQGNYAVNTYIKEVTDEEGIAQAEAKYNREKEKISYKENILDMKMKNLDTEISALTTEYETVKSVITKNVEKGFKRYSA